LVADLYGIEFTDKEMVEYAARVILTERAFNNMAGFTEADDKLPEFFYNEPSKATGAVFDVTDLEMQATQKFI